MCMRGADEAQRRSDDPPGDLDRGAEPPLVVDLGCTQMARTTWRACLCRLLYERPWWVPLLPFLLWRGRVAFKVP
jgi:hypothetical protein